MSSATGNHTIIEMNNITSDSGNAENLTPVDQPNCYGRCCGRVYKDWTQVAGSFVGTGGVVGYGVGYSMESEMIKIIAIAALVGVILLFHVRISWLKPEKELEDQVNRYANQVERLENNVNRLSDERDRLEKVLTDANTTVTQLAETLKVPVDRLDRLSEVYKEVKDKLSVVIAASEQYRKLSHVVAGQIKQLKSAGKTASAVNIDLVDHLDDLDSIEDSLSDEVNEYQTAVDYQKAENARLQAISEAMSVDLDGLQKRHLALVEMLRQLHENTAKIDEADDKYQSGGSDFKESVKLLKTGVAEDLQRLLQLAEGEIKDMDDSEKTDGLLIIASDSKNQQKTADDFSNDDDDDSSSFD